MDLKETALIGDEQNTHWYYRAKSAALLQCVADRSPLGILDVGAGSGFFARTLLRETSARFAICVDTGYENDWSESQGGKSIQFRRTIQSCDADLVLLMDVLEHVDDDVGLLARYVGMAPAGARFVISVPAFSWLWSGHDTFLEHRRRYTLDQLLSIVRAGGLAPRAGFYFYGLVFPVAAGRRLWRKLARSTDLPKSDLRLHRGWVNALLARACVAEARVARRNRVFGLTAFAIGEKRAGSRPLLR